MNPSQDLEVQGTSVRILGSTHRRSDGEIIEQQVSSFSPDIVCMEADPSASVVEHTPDVIAASDVSNRLGIEFWHIDAYKSDVNIDDVMSELSDEEREKVTGDVSTIEESREMRDAMRQASEKGHYYNTRRESTMFAVTRHAIQQYDRVLVIIGSAHFSEMYALISSL